MSSNLSVKFVSPSDTHHELHRDVFNRNRPSHFFYSARGYFNSFNLIVLFMVSSLIASFFSRMGLVLLLSFGSLFAACYFLVKTQAHSLWISRKAPSVMQDGTNLQIEYELRSSFLIPISSWSCFDRFTGCQDQVLARVSMGEEIRLGQSLKFKVSTHVEGAMGLHQLGPLTVKLRDPLGLFTFEVTDEGQVPLIVEPEVRSAPSLFLKGAPQSMGQGNFDVNERGASVNFMGIREYHFGDPVKLISWKLSAKHNRFLIKEFEKSVNVEVTLMIDLRPALHIGVPDKNSWDLVKEIAICILDSQIRQGNSVQVISQNLLVPFGNSPETRDLTMLQLMPQTPKDGRDIFDAALKLSPSQSTVVYIAPFFPDTYKSEIEAQLLRVHSEGRNLVVVLVDSLPFMNSQLIDLESIIGPAPDLLTRKRMNEFLARWISLGLTVYVVKNPLSYEKDLLHPYVVDEPGKIA
ncbi:MAG: DUF58 domain-containing protein [Bdellovibrionales bacterium]|nr:DUF58 domain-containing protein [Bdellovibrionales bacterium]